MRKVDGEDTEITEERKQFQRETADRKKHWKLSMERQNWKAREDSFRNISTTELVEVTLYKVQHTPAADSYPRHLPTRGQMVAGKNRTYQ